MNAEHFGYFFDTHAAEVAKLHDPCLAGVELRQLVQPFIERDERRRFLG
jgi:hypothetical protein